MALQCIGDGDGDGDSAVDGCTDKAYRGHLVYLHINSNAQNVISGDVYRAHLISNRINLREWKIINVEVVEAVESLRYLGKWLCFGCSCDGQLVS